MEKIERNYRKLVSDQRKPKTLNAMFNDYNSEDIKPYERLFQKLEEYEEKKRQEKLLEQAEKDDSIYSPDKITKEQLSASKSQSSKNEFKSNLRNPPQRQISRGQVERKIKQRQKNTLDLARNNYNIV